MAKYICSKCGVTASSKCVHNRSVFVEGNDGLYSHLLKYEIVRDGDKGQQTVELSSRRYQPDATDEELLLSVFNMIRDMSAADVKTYVCGNHKWVLQSAYCDLECCHKDY